MQKKDCIEFEQVAERGYGMDVHKESLVVFFLGGIIFATYTISLNGVLLEVSGTSNRALYTGIAGAGNILPAMFPLLGGWIIKQFGFLPYFVLLYSPFTLQKIGRTGKIIRTGQFAPIASY